MQPEAWEGSMVRYLEDHPKVVLAFLFGSYAKKKQWANSDIDIAVYLAPPYTLDDVTSIWNYLEDSSHRTVDLIVLNEAPAGVAWAAMKGKVLVDKNPRLRLELMLEKSREAEDFRQFQLDFWRLRQRRGRVHRLSAEQINAIVRRLDFLEIELADLPNFKTITQAEYISDRDRRRNLERLAENVVNATIDIGKVLLSATDLPMPDTYREVMIRLGEAGFISVALAEKLADMVRLRNVLAHQYLDIRWPTIATFVKNAAATMREFIRSIEHLLDTARSGEDQP